MSDVIGFIESLGVRPAIAARDYVAEVGGLAVDAATREALLRRDAGALAQALGGRDVMWCAIRSPDETPVDEPGRDDPLRDEPLGDEPQPDADGD